MGDSSKQKATEEEDQVRHVFKSGVDRPTFVTRIGARQSDLFIPKKVMVGYKLKLPDKLFLVDVQGNKWETTVKQWPDGRVLCAGGAWRRLCNVNNIKKDDTCICEFFLEGCQDPYILVRVLDIAGTSGNANLARKNLSYKKKHATDRYGADIFRRGLATQPKKRPFFMSRSKARRHELTIPKEVIKDFKLQLPDALFLVDEKGNRWETTVKQRKDGVLFCSGGFRSLCNVNNINEDNICICEFFLETNDPHILVRRLDATV